MEEIQVGEYVRIKNGLIGQFYNIEEGYDGNIIVNFEEFAYEYEDVKQFYEDILKHSKDIIDLIEVGDIVNGEKVIGIFEIYNNEELIIGKRILTEYRKAQYTGLNNNYYLYETDIKTILTHEQYEKNCYKRSLNK